MVTPTLIPLLLTSDAPQRSGIALLGGCMMFPVDIHDVLHRDAISILLTDPAPKLGAVAEEDRGVWWLGYMENSDASIVTRATKYRLGELILLSLVLCC